MFADVDYAHPEVQEDVLNWGKWVVKELGLKGVSRHALLTICSGSVLKRMSL